MKLKPMLDYMKEHDLTQSDMAEALGVTPGAISKAVIANRKVYLTVDRSEKIASAHEVVRFGRGKREQPASVEQKA